MEHKCFSNTQNIDLMNIEKTNEETITEKSNFDMGTYTVEDAEKLVVPKRKMLLEPWLMEKSLTLITGKAGIGKTWFSMSLAKAISEGSNFGPWKGVAATPCLYFDGEMSMDEFRDRFIQLKATHPNLHIYSNEYSISTGLMPANLMDTVWRHCWSIYLVKNGFKVWFLDNISSITAGLDENSRQDWSTINQWFLELRRYGISTIMLHHTGKSGIQRGTSSREDNIDTSILLKLPPGRPTNQCTFNIEFTKKRCRQTSLVEDINFKLFSDNDGITWDWSWLQKDTSTEVLALLSKGMKQAEIAKRLNIHPSRISQIKKEKSLV